MAETKKNKLKTIDTISLLGLDRLLSMSFLSMFWRIIAASIVAFLAIWGIFWGLGEDWSIGQAFIQLTNPSIGFDNAASWREWASVVIINLFGLFVLNGVLLTLFVNWISNRKDRREKGEARYKLIFKHKFSVIIGGHRIAASLARDLMNAGDIDYIIIQTQRSPERLRREIESEITEKVMAERIIIYAGERTSKHQIEELNLNLANEVYIIGEPNHIDGSSHDALNMQTWNIIKDLYTDDTDNTNNKQVACHVMFEYQSTFNAFQFTDLKTVECTTFKFIPFSLYENWAQQVLNCPKDINQSHRYIPLDGLGGLSYSSHQRVHLIVVGMSKMGISLAIEAAHNAHYPNFNNPNAGRPRTLITFIDRNAKQEMLFFMGRFKTLFQLARWRFVKAPEGITPPNDNSWHIYQTQTEMSATGNNSWHDPLKDQELKSPYCNFSEYLGEDFIDIDFEFIEGDVALPAIQKYISDACADCSANTTTVDNSSKTTIAVCLPNAAEAMSASLYFDDSVYENVQQIWVQQSESGALVNSISDGQTGENKNKFRALRPFGMLEQCDYLERSNSLLPKLVAYAYGHGPKNLDNEYKNAGSPDKFIEFINSVCKEWDEISNSNGKSSIAKRWSNIYCANSFDTKIRATKIDLSKADLLQNDDTINKLAEVEHNRWVIEQLLLGYKPCDPNNNNPNQDRNELKSRKIHPDIRSNEKLGDTLEYDKLIAKIIPTAIHICQQSSKSKKSTTN